MVLSGDEDTRGGDESKDLVFRFVLEVADAEDVLFNVLYLHVCVICRHAMMEGLLVVLKFAAKLVHSVDLIFACSHVEGMLVVALA